MRVWKCKYQWVAHYTTKQCYVHSCQLHLPQVLFILEEASVGKVRKAKLWSNQ